MGYTIDEEGIIIELDEDDIEILKKGGGVTKETEHPDIPNILITKWDIGKEIEDALAEEENIGDVVFEAEKPIKVVNSDCCPECFHQKEAEKPIRVVK